ncbi:MAG TPA: Crp/Fnr family transcriptional regulator [Syntrophobacteraceae bacterium]|nr:Crp/Fnr family transcriptional regulator [Syntrophobacteraceae bacterium]
MSETGFVLKVESHPYFQRFKPEHLAILEKCASMAEFEPGSHLFHEKERATRQYLIVEGRVALDLHVPGRDPWTLMTAGEGGIVGYAWAYPPHRYYYTCRAVDKTRAIVLDAEYLAKKCKEDTDFGYEVMVGCTSIMAERLQAAELQLLNLVLKCY